MEKQSLAYIIPGAGQKAKDYDLLAGMLREDEYEPVFVDLDWKLGSFKAWRNQLSAQASAAFSSRGQFSGLHRGYDISIGFSYGAVVGLLGSVRNSIMRISCSAPNVFNPELRKKFDALTHKSAGFVANWEEFNSLSLQKNFELDILLHGEKEPKDYELSAQQLETLLGRDFSVETRIVPGAAHNVNSAKYVEAIEKLVLSHEQMQKRNTAA
jgi:hypothetical protein